jgi:uncharacterized membrane protein YcaP (DUF421 family)
MSGNPVVIIRDGVLDIKAMKELRFTTDDLIQSLRIQGIFDINEVQYAVVETTGNVSAYQKFPNQNATNESVNFSGENENPPQLIVDNGKPVLSGLTETGLSFIELEKILAKEKIKLENIFLMTAQSPTKYTIIKKDGSNL